MTSIEVELVLRTTDTVKVLGWVKDLFKGYRTFQSENRFTVDVPSNWVGFKDGTIKRLLETYNESLYLAVAYITDDELEAVTDFSGNPVDRFYELIDGKKCFKYVKKKLRVMKILNREEKTFTAKGYQLKLEYTEPVVEVLNIYSVGSVSGVTPESLPGLLE